MNPKHDLDVAIIGAGFSGSLTAVQLLQKTKGSGQLEVALIEKDPNAFGKGIAYGTTCESHLLNVPASKMSALPEIPNHFVDWIRETKPTLPKSISDKNLENSFVPRKVYGEYVRSLIEKTFSESSLKKIFSEVKTIEPINLYNPSDESSGYKINFTHHEQITARKIILAIGNFPPAQLFSASELGNAYIETPWTPESLDKICESGDVFILGSGLTALDLVLTAAKRKENGTIYILSRKGLFPQPHKLNIPVYPAFLEHHSFPKTILDLLRKVRTEVKKAATHRIDWRGVIDALRPFAQNLWKNFNEHEKRRFLRHLKSYWETHRHRAAAEVLDTKNRLQDQGRLIPFKGRIQKVSPLPDSKLQIKLKVYESRSRNRNAVSRELTVKYLVNCTGPETNYSRLQSSLIRNLLDQGLVRADPLRLGLDVTAQGALINQAGESSESLFTLGSPKKGLLFETTAVPELHLQASELADHLISLLNQDRQSTSMNCLS